MFIYIIYEDTTEKITYMYAIEQEIKVNLMQIKNIYSTTIVDESNSLERFFRYDEQFEQENLEKRLNTLISKINVIVDKEYLQKKITEYLKNNDDEILMLEKEGTELIPAKIPKRVFTKHTTDTTNIIDRKPKSKRGNTNRDSIPVICYGKEYRSYSAFIKEYNLPHSSVWYALNRGEKPEDIIERYKNKPEGQERINPIKRKNLKKYEYLGQKLTLSELAELSGLAKNTIVSRINVLGWSVEKAVETPPIV